MKIYKRTFSSRLFVWLYHLHFFHILKLALSPPFIWYCRRVSVRHEILGIPVYVWDAHQAAAFGLEAVERALKMLGESSPYLMEKMRSRMNGIIIIPVGTGVTRSGTGRWYFINPSKYKPLNPGNTKAAARGVLRLLGAVVSVSQYTCLANGRFGYFGIKNAGYLFMKAEIRALRRCFSLERQLEVLTVIAMCYKVMDLHDSRPGRRYHPEFAIREMERLSFGKKLRLHPKDDTLVIESTSGSGELQNHPLA